MSSDQQFNLVLNRLESILKLLALQTTAGKKAGDVAILLERAGLDRKLIAEVLDTSQDSVRSLISQSRKSKTPRKGATRAAEE
jgi:DNA-directed RNA polymerase specialized sigma24 family protein